MPTRTHIRTDAIKKDYPAGISTRRGFVQDEACKLWMPFYRYGQEQSPMWNLAGETNHGIITPTVAPDPEGMRFNGGYLTCGDDPIENGEVTVLVWFNSTGSNPFQYIIDTGASASYVGYALEYNKIDNLMRFIRKTSTRGGAIYSDFIFEQYMWHNIAMVWDNYILYGYRNGQKLFDEQLPAISFTRPYKIITIGASKSLNASYFFRGYLGEIVIFSRALSELEVKEYYESTRRYYGV